MKTFRNYLAEQSGMLTERFINLLDDDKEKKHEYVDAVWNILQKSYAKIGGIKGSGFENKESMINKIPFWKVATKSGKPVAVVLYKDKNGRKVVAAGTDGTVAGKAQIVDIMKNDISRAFGEKSKGALGLIMKLYPWDVLESFVLTPKQAQKALGKEVISLSEVPRNEIPEDGVEMLKKYPQLKDYAYLRDLGGTMTFKVALGTPGISIR